MLTLTAAVPAPQTRYNPCEGKHTGDRRPNFWWLPQTELTRCKEGHTCIEGKGCVKDAPKPCCLAITAQCLACAVGVTQAKYCAKNPRTVGCPVADPTCALIRCKEGYTCIEGKGCVKDQHPPICCRAMHAQCLACTEGSTVGEYCLANPKTAGCPAIEPNEPKEPHMCIDKSPKFCQKRLKHLGGKSGGYTAKLCGRKKFTRECQQSCGLC